MNEEQRNHAQELGRCYARYNFSTDFMRERIQETIPSLYYWVSISEFLSYASRCKREEERLMKQKLEEMKN